MTRPGIEPSLPALVARAQPTVPPAVVTCHLFHQGQPVGECHFQRRLECIEKEIIGPRHEKMRHGMIDKRREPFSIRKKDFWDIHQSREILDGK